MSRHQALWAAAAFGLVAGLVGTIYWLVGQRDGFSVSPAARVASTAPLSPAATHSPTKPNGLGAVHGEDADHQGLASEGHNPDDPALAAGGPFASPSGTTDARDQTPEEMAAFVTLPADSTRWRYSDATHPTLSGEDFGGADLRFVDLSNANLQGANFKDAQLDFADLRHADLQGAVFDRTQLVRTDLREAVFHGATMTPPVNIHGADLRGADLRDVRFPSSTTVPAKMTLSGITSTRLDDADLRGVVFSWTMIAGSVFDGADLRGADLSTAVGRPDSLRGALYDQHTRLPGIGGEIDPHEWQMIFVPAAD